MEKLIIENRTEMSMHDALAYAMTVVGKGRISGLNKDHYCYLTFFAGNIGVSSWKNKMSDRLLVFSSDDDDD